MSNYTKFDLNTIRQKLKNNEYAGLTGAMRAIGKTQQLNEADKEKARAMARKHFGEEAPAAKAPKVKKAAKKAAKKAPKASKKKVGKKAPGAKKTAKKGAKRGPRTKASTPEVATGTEQDTAPAPAKAPEPAARGRRKAAPASAPKPVVETSRRDVISEMSAVISSVGDSIKAMEAAKRMFPKAELERNVEIAAGAMTRAVQAIDKEITTPRLGTSADSTPTIAPSRKKASKKGTRVKATAAPKTTEAPPAETNEVPELIEEEQEQLALARQSQPAAAMSEG